MKSRFFLYVSLFADLFIAVAKFVCAGFTQSSAMISEGVHSVIDAISQVLLIWGVKSSNKNPDESHPFGYGRELYFWSFIVSLMIFTLGGCISIYQGIMRFKQPSLHGDPLWNYIVLIIAFVFNFISMLSALKAFNRQRGNVSFWEAVIRTKDPSTIIVLLGDFGDLLGLIVAFLGIYLGRLYNDPKFDGIASLIIGAILITISALLIRESKSLLMGETISKATLRKIINMVETDDAIIKVKKHFSIYRSPDDALLQLNASFKENLSTNQITQAIENMIIKVQKEYPSIKQIFIEPVK